MNEKEYRVKSAEGYVGQTLARIRDAQNAIEAHKSVMEAEKQKAAAEASLKLSNLERDLSVLRVQLSLDQANLSKAKTDWELGFEQM